MEIKETEGELFNQLDPDEQLLGLIIKGMTNSKDSDEVSKQIVDLMHGRFTSDAAKALISFGQTVIDAMAIFKEYYNETYRDKPTVVEGSDTVN